MFCCLFVSIVWFLLLFFFFFVGGGVARNRRTNGAFIDFLMLRMIVRWILQFSVGTPPQKLVGVLSKPGIPIDPRPTHCDSSETPPRPAAGAWRADFLGSGAAASSRRPGPLSTARADWLTLEGERKMKNIAVIGFRPLDQNKQKCKMLPNNNHEMGV